MCSDQSKDGITTVVIEFKIARLEYTLCEARACECELWFNGILKWRLLLGLQSRAFRSPIQGSSILQGQYI